VIRPSLEYYDLVWHYALNKVHIEQQNAEKCCEMAYTAILCNSSNTNYHIENCNMRYQLAKVDSVIDLGVRFDSKLAFLAHINEKVNKAYSILGIIKRNFTYLDTNSFDNIEVVDELVLHKNGQVKNNICPLYLVLRPYCLQKKISKLVDKCRRHSR